MLIFRKKPIGKWVRPYAFEKTDEKMLTLNIKNPTITSSVNKIKLFTEKLSSLSRDLQWTPSTEIINIEVRRKELERMIGIGLNQRTRSKNLRSNILHFTVKTIDPNDPRGRRNDFVEAQKNKS